MLVCGSWAMEEVVDRGTGREMRCLTMLVCGSWAMEEVVDRGTGREMRCLTMLVCGSWAMEEEEKEKEEDVVAIIDLFVLGIRGEPRFLSAMCCELIIALTMGRSERDTGYIDIL